MRECPNCGQKNPESDVMCAKCGMPVPPARDGYIPGLRMHFRTVVILATIFCAAMILWLPR